jgi:hypothetical protein
MPGEEALLRAHAAVVQPADQDVHNRLSTIEDMLKRLQRGSSEKQQKRCYGCGSTGHLIKDSKAPTAGNRGSQASGTSASVLSVETWLLDSGTTHHTSAGNGAGAAAFLSYRAFQVPWLVQFGKRGATARVSWC